jgi:hypothetical protein
LYPPGFDSPYFAISHFNGIGLVRFTHTASIHIGTLLVNSVTLRTDKVSKTRQAFFHCKVRSLGFLTSPRYRIARSTFVDQVTLCRYRAPCRWLHKPRFLHQIVYMRYLYHMQQLLRYRGCERDKPVVVYSGKVHPYCTGDGDEIGTCERFCLQRQAASLL